MDLCHHLVERVRTGHGQYLRVRGFDDTLFGTQAAGNDHLTVLCQRLADGIERLFDGGVDKAAGVDDNQFGLVITGGNLIALGTQAGEDAFGVDGGLGAAEANKAYPGDVTGGGARHSSVSGGKERILSAFARQPQ